MTHMKTMAEHDGDFGYERESKDRPCPKCKAGPVMYRSWESSCGGYEDYKYRCTACGHTWWIDGIDS